MLEQGAVFRRERVKARGDERSEADRDGHRLEVTGRNEGVALSLDAPLGEEGADHLDGVERHPAGALDDRSDLGIRQSGKHAAQELAHLGIGHRLERDRGRVAAPVPHPARVSRSSGRASVTTNIGCARDQSRRCSTKSRVPLSAH